MDTTAVVFASSAKERDGLDYHFSSFLQRRVIDQTHFHAFRHSHIKAADPSAHTDTQTRAQTGNLMKLLKEKFSFRVIFVHRCSRPFNNSISLK